MTISLHWLQLCTSDTAEDNQPERGFKSRLHLGCRQFAVHFWMMFSIFFFFLFSPTICRLRLFLFLYLLLYKLNLQTYCTSKRINVFAGVDCRIVQHDSPFIFIHTTCSLTSQDMHFNENWTSRWWLLKCHITMSPVLAQPSHSSGANTSAPMTHTFQPLHPFARLELVLGPVPAVHHTVMYGDKRAFTLTFTPIVSLSVNS